MERGICKDGRMVRDRTLKMLKEEQSQRMWWPQEAEKGGAMDSFLDLQERNTALPTS